MYDGQGMGRYKGGEIRLRHQVEVGGVVEYVRDKRWNVEM